ncbi:MAG: type II secretion system protein N [Gammaproteobacteria bacterium]|nr:type II secretion system protein N [Gammaproteobacteria bacterium]
MSTKKVSLIFVVFLLLSLMATLPAALVLPELKLAKEIKYGNVNGVWWNSTIDWISYEQFKQVDIALKLDFSCLVLAKLCFTASNTQSHLLLSQSLISKELSIRNSQLQIDFSEINSLLTKLLIKPKGTLNLEISAINLKDNILNNLIADIAWHQVGVQGENFNLESVGAKVSHQKGNISFEFYDNSDKLDLSGFVTINAQGMLQADVQIKTLAKFPSTLKSVLQSGLRQAGNNIYHYKVKNLPLNLANNSIIF